MKKKLKILLALAASIAAIAIGQRSQPDGNQRSQPDAKQKDTRTQKALVEGVDDVESWFV
ncbi:MAG: hypothetical protein ACC682_13095 [Gemmatimonadota bacterium]